MTIEQLVKQLDNAREAAKNLSKLEQAISAQPVVHDGINKHLAQKLNAHIECTCITANATRILDDYADMIKIYMRDTHVAWPPSAERKDD